MAQLKISDLSVGDWVEWMGERCKVDLPLLNTVFPHAKIYPAYTSATLQPIPITPEILEKNGFVKNDAYLHKIDIDDNITIGVRRQSDGYMFELKREKRRIGELLAIIRGLRNVHQLQHALRLAGIEKEIEL